MKATTKIEWLVLSTGVALAGATANEPLVSLGAAIAALLAASSPRRSAFAWLNAPSGQPPFSGPNVFATCAFRGFQRGESSSPTSSNEDDDEAPAADSGGPQSYEEFAAGLEDDGDEEISFMPYYASDTVETRSSGDSSGDAAAVTDSLISNDLQDVGELVSKLPAPRRFALGTVAIIRRLLEPGQVEQILLEQRRYPRLRFGDVAIQLALLSGGEVQEMLVAQEEGIFSDEEISDARRRLASYHGGRV